MARSIPTLDDLQKYNVNRAGQIEGIRQSLYDFQTYAQAGQTSLTFFQIPVGQSNKTLADTNMEAAGALPAPKRFLIESIEIHFFPGNAVSAFGAQAAAENINDVYDVAKSGWLDLFIGSKSYLTEAPLGRFPSSSGLGIFGAFADATTAGANMQSRIDYARFGGKVYQMEPPILLVPTQNFKITLNWPTAVAINANARIGVVMNGILFRNSQ